jgi:hypothetical protein
MSRFYAVLVKNALIFEIFSKISKKIKEKPASAGFFRAFVIEKHGFLCIMNKKPNKKGEKFYEHSD